MEYSLRDQLAEAVARQIKKIEDSILSNSSDALAVTVNDHAYIDKLERALRRNFDYIARKDLLTESDLPNKSRVVLNDVLISKHFINSSSSKPSSIPPPPKPPNRLGIGSQLVQPNCRDSNPPAATSVEPLSIYVSRLPTDITQDELEILFGAQAKIKRVKIYVDGSGKQKGDALITYYKAEDAVTACLRFNGLDIGEGHVLCVTPADFGGPNRAVSAPSLPNGSQLNGSITLQPVLRAVLPPEMSTGSSPVLVIMNVFDQTDDRVSRDANFVEDIEADMLVECCCFGKVGLMQVLLLDADALHRLNTLNEGIMSDGAVAVSFDKISSAVECAKALRGRWFDGRQLRVEIIDSSSYCDPDHVCSEAPVKQAAHPIPPPPRPPNVPRPKAIHVPSEYSKLTDIDIQQQPGDVAFRRNRELTCDDTLVGSIVESVDSAGDVEDFLNSLL